MLERDLALTLAGGGNRAFYQAGLLNRWADRLLPRVRVIASCSAGACVATVFLAGRANETNEFWKQRRAGVTRNFDLRRLAAGRPPGPHGEVYRDTMIFAMRDGGLERVREQPFPILVLTAGWPQWLPTTAAMLVGLAAYNLEKRLFPARVHPRFGRRMGFLPVVFDARDCDTPEQLADLILASSASPPFTPVGRFGGRRLLDGGLVDNAPAFVAEQIDGVRRHVIMLTRPYPNGVLGRHGQRLYVGPTQPTPISRWDYTRPELLDATIAMGERESERHVPALDELLADSGVAECVRPDPVRI
ncbi:MAG TPA: patatin-like phospholipase family protein [Candidatus Kryptonia bacterium]|nr:patatin-like phospholipase family protein [Candidatus Kryptonia bacterium]